jgi:prolyl-tRNA editing enzyme YbaK/EbsC (Cys-tRNA(Pro) deacylase)
MKVVLDEELAGFETFYCGGGSRDRLLELRVDEVKGLTDAIVAKISE